MTKYSVRAISEGGEVLTLRVSAPDAERAVDRLRRRGLHAVAVEESSDERRRRVPWGWVRFDEVSELLRELGSLLESGLGLVLALEVLRDHGFSRRGAAIAGAFAEEVAAGRLLSEAMARFPREFGVGVREAVAAGERSGTLDAVLARLADDRLRLSDRRKRLLTASIHPAITVLVAVAVVGIVSHLLIPRLQEVYAGFDMELPRPTQLTVAAFEHLRVHGLAYLGALLGLVASVRWARRFERFRRGWHRALLALPVLGRVYLWSAYAEGFRLLGMLYRAGLPVLRALELTAAAVNNQRVRDGFLEVKARVEGGSSLADGVRESPAFNAYCRAMVDTGERSGQLELMLDRIATKYEGSLVHLFGRLEATFTPALTVATIAVVGTVVATLYLPFVALIEQLSR
ncbi:MAG: type II secretion system F family protein [Planctomycetota bacterium]|nr:MAG: type II secretion system F family protein [Planctomycetota bacterium]